MNGFLKLTFALFSVIAIVMSLPPLKWYLRIYIGFCVGVTNSVILNQVIP